MWFDLFDKLTHPLYALGVLSVLIDAVIWGIWLILILRYFHGGDYRPRP